MLQQDTSLKHLNSFSLSASAKQVITAQTTQQLSDAWRIAKQLSQPLLILGGGSNVLFLEDFAGTVVLNRITGISVTDDSESWRLHVGAGENWHQLVCYTLEHHIPGLENLALIPGCVGSAPIQNIGAYGIELSHVCEYVDIIELATQQIQRLSASDCQFGYRESIFKHEYRDGYAIIAVGLRLSKNWQPKLSYGGLTKLNPSTASYQDIFEAVCQMRREKLPDPAITGNAGSFYKNPVVDAALAHELQSRYPTIPLYPQSSGQVKLAAGWLIEQAGLKGYKLGGAAVHQHQALVLVNVDNASGEDIKALASHIRRTVAEKFSVLLEPEVRFIAAMGEIDSIKALS
jgi:UDP-N-acetylmuramate dehydrogenase